jgi:hypothetical protein
LTRGVATVGGRPITATRLEARIAELRRGPRGRHLPPDDGDGPIGLRRWIVQELVTEEVLLQEARAVGIANVARFGDLSGIDIARLVARVTAHVTVADADVRAYYDRNRDRYRRPEARRVWQVVLDVEAAARRIATRLRAGKKVPQRTPTIPADDAGRMPQADTFEIHAGELAGALEEAIFGTDVGAIVGPIRTEHGWHVVRVEAVTREWIVPYADARTEIEAELLAAARIEAFGEWLARRRRALAVIEPNYEHPGHPVHGFANHRH